MDNDLYEAIKDIATRYQIKCSKYPKEELSYKLCEILFEEAFNEFHMMNSVNSKLAERSAE